MKSEEDRDPSQAGWLANLGTVVPSLSGMEPEAGDPNGGDVWDSGSGHLVFYPKVCDRFRLLGKVSVDPTPGRPISQICNRFKDHAPNQDDHSDCWHILQFGSLLP